MSEDYGEKTDCHFEMEIYDVYLWIDAEGLWTGAEFEVWHENTSAISV